MSATETRGAVKRVALPDPVVRYLGIGWFAPELSLLLSAALTRSPGDTVVADEVGLPAGPWVIQRALRAARPDIVDLPPKFRFQDLRHYFASLLRGRFLRTFCGLKPASSG